MPPYVSQNQYSRSSSEMAELTSFFDTTMYEHYMMGAVKHLAKADALLAIPRFSDLLLRASRMDRRPSGVKEEDYSYYTVGSLRPDQRGGGDIPATIIHAIAKFATSAVEANPTNVRRVLKLLSNYKPGYSVGLRFMHWPWLLAKRLILPTSVSRTRH